MPHRTTLHALCWAVVGALVACSGRVEVPDGGADSVGIVPPHPTTNGGAAGRVSVGGAAGQLSSIAHGGSPEDPGNLPTGGAPTELSATATLKPTSGNQVTGTVELTQLDDKVELSVALNDCPQGPHGLHLHANTSCGDNANAAGGHWSPQGEGIADIVCQADGTGQLSFAPPDGTWSLGGPHSTDVLRHAVILHAGPSSDPGGRIACGIPVKPE